MLILIYMTNCITLRTTAIYEWNGSVFIIRGFLQGHECHGKEALSVYSMGNFVFPQAGVKRFFDGDKPSRKSLKGYIKTIKKLFSPTQFSYMFKITVNR